MFISRYQVYENATWLHNVVKKSGWDTCIKTKKPEKLKLKKKLWTSQRTKLSSGCFYVFFFETKEKVLVVYLYVILQMLTYFYIEHFYIYFVFCYLSASAIFLLVCLLGEVGEKVDLLLGALSWQIKKALGNVANTILSKKMVIS